MNLWITRSHCVCCSESTYTVWACRPCCNGLPARSIQVRVIVCYNGFAASADSSVTTDLLHVQEHSCHARLGRCHRRRWCKKWPIECVLLRRVCWPLCKLVISLVFKIWSVMVILPAFCRYSGSRVCEEICLYKFSCVQILGSAL